MKGADVEDGYREGATQAELTELRESRKRIRFLEPESDILSGGQLPGTWPQPKMIFPLVRKLAANGFPRR